MRVSREEEWIMILLNNRQLTKQGIVSAITTADREKRSIKWLDWKLRRMQSKGLIYHWVHFVSGELADRYYRITPQGRVLLGTLRDYRQALHGWTP
jgi:hypothetical protein